jgi:hypothetical protein
MGSGDVVASSAVVAQYAERKTRTDSGRFAHALTDPPPTGLVVSRQ